MLPFYELALKLTVAPLEKFMTLQVYQLLHNASRLDNDTVEVDLEMSSFSDESREQDIAEIRDDLYEEERVTEVEEQRKEENDPDRKRLKDMGLGPALDDVKKACHFINSMNYLDWRS
ncbi:hypothetical protein CHS0354_038226 [Potamilus streckersoni]|uniref:Uncharacterized protein n=1 Tax=Potamilus streckersoni TaxID=2493646 RepID=A0AAE0W4E4_9BIVA|nr:hypothetical protein CHS0354_038226 [Potamilus streckersoni]